MIVRFFFENTYKPFPLFHGVPILYSRDETCSGQPTKFHSYRGYRVSSHVFVILRGPSYTGLRTFPPTYLVLSICLQGSRIFQVPCPSNYIDLHSPTLLRPLWVSMNFQQPNAEESFTKPQFFWFWFSQNPRHNLKENLFKLLSSSGYTLED